MCFISPTLPQDSDAKKGVFCADQFPLEGLPILLHMGKSVKHSIIRMLYENISLKNFFLFVRRTKWSQRTASR